MNIVDEDPDPLCCCEYFDRHEQRNHIFLCCCQCTELDEICERLITCKTVDRKLKKEMWFTFKDRLRIPYPGGARLLLCESLLPLFLIILSQLIGAINMYSTCIAFVLSLYVLYYARKSYYRANHRTSFCFYWCIWSVAYLVVLFQTNLPLMEILPEENFVFVLLLTFMLISFYMVHRINKRHYSTSGLQSALASDDDSATVLIMPEDKNSNTSKDCNTTNDEEGEYELWICSNITYYNYKYYIAACCLGTVTFLWYSNLVITTVCHPFPVFRVFNVEILMPDDCSDVYDQYDIALCFVGALYALVLAVFCFIKFIQELYYITKSIAFSNWHSDEQHQRHSRKNCINNWRSFLCN
uniref:CSON000877 protein n=1 Tax=Culicoides sonorensis TaxID=179676 RepID=A0A336MJI3_CULSO